MERRRKWLFNSSEKVTSISPFTDVILIILVVDLGLFSCIESWKFFYLLEELLNVLTAVSFNKPFSVVDFMLLHGLEKRSRASDMC